MPRSTPIRLAAAFALALALSVSFAPAAFAKGFAAQLRVVGSGGKVLVEKTIATGAVSVKTSPSATCFGPGTGGSGEKASLKANTAMGLLARGAETTGSLRPLLVSDHFDFGLALCGIGSSVAKGSASWYLKIDHKSSSVSGDKATIHAGDEVLYDLATTEAPSYKYPDELALSAPAKVQAGQPFTVRAWSYDEKGKRKPAAGVTVSGASGPTGSDGKATVTLARPAKLAASAKGEIPSAKVAVCVGGKCPPK
jgi:hypothetical protein